jgi:hypothetical protein
LKVKVKWEASKLQVRADYWNDAEANLQRKSEDVEHGG